MKKLVDELKEYAKLDVEVEMVKCKYEVGYEYNDKDDSEFMGVYAGTSEHEAIIKCKSELRNAEIDVPNRRYVIWIANKI